MIHFDEGEISDFVNSDFEIAEAGDFEDTALVPMRVKGSVEPTAQYQANFLKTGVNL